MILIYTHKLTNRVKYIFKTIFTDVLQMEVSFTNITQDFENYEGVKINYTNKKLNTELFFQSSTLLFENGIKEQNITIFEWENTKCFFEVGKEAALPFDVFAASFYLITRYEEYLPHIRDAHDRFIAAESLACQNNFLQIPLVNIWINKIETCLKKAYPTLKIPKKTFKYQATIDIDSAFAYKHKGLLRVMGGLVKSLLSPPELKNRIQVLLNKKTDPFDTFAYQSQIHKKYNIKPIYFFLLGDYALNDKNISFKNRKFQSLIKSIADYYPIGIHPSYNSNKDVIFLKTELKRLKTITHKDITKSRQHFLKLNLPDTYRNLILNDIEEDYTMGYAEKCGFRASICSPYYFYDIDTEAETRLKIIPFAVMEATFQYYTKTAINDTINTITNLINEVKKVNGTFVSVWHNESLSDEGIWKNWRKIYENMLNETIN